MSNVSPLTSRKTLYAPWKQEKQLSRFRVFFNIFMRLSMFEIRYVFQKKICLLQLTAIVNILSWKRLKIITSNCCDVNQLAWKLAQKTSFFCFFGVVMDIEKIKSLFKTPLSVQLLVKNTLQYMHNQWYLPFSNGDLPCQSVGGWCIYIHVCQKTPFLHFLIL